MTQPFRLADRGRTDRTHPIGFTFDGQAQSGFVGDTIASALLANGIHLVGRSFKYHRPRGILSAGPEEPSALVTIDRGADRVTPNLRATQLELYDGLTVRSQNRFPSLRFDLGSFLGIASPLLSAGFYYKTFMWPRAAWKHLYEPAIRAAAGLGRAPRHPDPDRYLHRYAHCDVLVIGAGPAGLAAALGAASTGARVILCDEQAEPGGSLLDEPAAMIDGWTASAWLTEVLKSLSNVITLLPRTTAFGWYPDNLIGLVERVTDHLTSPDPNLPRERLWQVRAERVVIATGAIERPLVFPGNDRPGIMLAGAARTYLHRYGVAVGRRVLIATQDDSAYRTALDLHAAGVEIAGIADLRGSVSGPLVDAARAVGIPLHAGSAVLGTSGRLRVRAVRITGVTKPVECDTVLMGGGWTPSVHLHAQSRGRLRFDPRTGAFLPADTPARAVSAGACAGDFDLGECLLRGHEAGAGTRRGFIVRGIPPVAPSIAPRQAIAHSRAFVDFQNDVTTNDLRVAAEEGFRSIEHIKRYTTLGMATDQGKTANSNGLAAVAGLVDRAPPEIGLTTYRPPYSPVTFGALAGAARGDLFDPVRKTPMHDWAEARGAVFEDVGTWKRARYFPRNDETMRQAVDRECLAVRRGVGMFDASTLGKIEVVGPDAAAFLDRIYPGSISTLSVGRCRYALLLGEDGFIRDDGVIARLAHDRFHVTITTGGAAGTLHLMEDYLQTEFPDLRTWLTSTTDQWAVIAVQGPRAAAVLAALTDAPSLPHMSVSSCVIAGISCRLFRVSFTGEVGFEINVPAGHTQTVWNAVLEAGAEHAITPYGTEAMHVLRAEVGFIIVGQETDGTVVPDDLGLNWAVSKNKPDFVGKRSLVRADMLRNDRKQLVGLLTRDRDVVLTEGAQVLGAAGAAPGLGHVTSAYYSANAGRSIALALLAGGRDRIGEMMVVPMNGTTVEVEVAHPRFLDGGLGGGPAPTGNVATAIKSAPAAQGTSPLPRSWTAASPRSARVRLTALAPTTRLLVRAGPAAATSIGLSTGVLLGSAPCRAVVSRERAALWLGPDEWLVLAPDNETGLLDASTGSHPASLVDVSHRHASIEISGPEAVTCLNGFCALDLHITAFPVGMCTRTLLGKAEIVLWRLGNETFHIEVTRSLASYVWMCLEEGRREFLDPLEA